jgi:phosphonate ABC transporter permease subunit PhnE
MKDILTRYPEIKKPGPRYWLIPSVIVIIAILLWSSHDTELTELRRGADGNMTIRTPSYRWDAALNILFGVSRPAMQEINGVSVPVTREVDGQMVPVMRRRGGLMHPDLSKHTIQQLIPDMLVTVEMALLGTIIAFVFAFPMSFLAARNIVGKSPPSMAIYGVVRFLFNFLSAIPALVVALIFTVIMGVGPAAGTMALALNSVGMLGRMFAEALEGVDRGPIEALQATGAGNIQTVAYGVLPQIGPLFLAYSIYRWDINVRMSMILGFVGAGGIGVFLQQNINLFKYSQVSTSFIMILVTVTLLDWGNSWIQRKVL